MGFLNIITSPIRTSIMTITNIICPVVHLRTPSPKNAKDRVEGILANNAKKRNIPKGNITIPAT